MQINHVAHGKRPVPAEINLRLGCYFGQSPRYWINLQCQYDIAIAEDLLSEQVAREVRPLTAVGQVVLRHETQRILKYNEYKMLVFTCALSNLHTQEIIP